MNNRQSKFYVDMSIYHYFFGAKRIIENIVDRSAIYSFNIKNIFDFRKSIKLPEAI